MWCVAYMLGAADYFAQEHSAKRNLRDTVNMAKSAFLKCVLLLCKFCLVVSDNIPDSGKTKLESGIMGFYGVGTFKACFLGLIIVAAIVICVKCCDCRRSNPSNTIQCADSSTHISTPSSSMGPPSYVDSASAPNHQINSSCLSNSAHSSLHYNTNQQPISDLQQSNMIGAEGLPNAGHLEFDSKSGEFYLRVNIEEVAPPTYEEAMHNSRNCPGNNLSS